MTSKIVVNNIEADAGVSTVAFGSKVSSSEFVGDLTGNVTGNATGLSGSPTLSGISSVSTTNLTVNGNAYPATGPLSNRNFIINGAMQVAQRGTQTTSVSSGHNYICDRFSIYVETLGTWTLDQSTDSPNGFSNSFKATCTTADASPVSNAQCSISQKIEAQNLQSLSFGTSDAQATTLSFWVKSNKTGNASIVVFQPNNSNKMVSFQYSISSANTWEQKTITIPADTAGVINNDNGSGFQIEWWLNSGSNKTGGSHQATWSTYDATNRNVSNLGVGGATSDYFAITGVQLEVGSVATPFEHRSFGDELRRCQRYYYNGGEVRQYAAGYSVNARGSGSWINFPVTMRDTANVTQSGITYSGANTAQVHNASAHGFTSYFISQADNTTWCQFTYVAEKEL